MATSLACTIFSVYNSMYVSMTLTKSCKKDCVTMHDLIELMPVMLLTKTCTENSNISRQNIISNNKWNMNCCKCHVLHLKKNCSAV